MRTPYLDDGDVRLYQGDVLDVLREMEAESVQTCVTSPPYWGLRDYGTATWEGGAIDCDHEGRPLASSASTLTGNRGEGIAETDKLATNGVPYRETCGKCGATRKDAQLGLEPTPGEYVARMVEVFREVRRVLRDDGTLWLNLGDSYAGSGPSGASYESATTKRRAAGGMDGAFRVSSSLGKRGLTYAEKKPVAPPGLKPKDLVGIPWRVAFALQEDGWYLRADVIWAKPNPMPESVTDRPTKAHEYLFLLSKSPRYFYDHEAVREPISENWKAGAAPPMPLNGSHVLTSGRRGNHAKRVYEVAKGANARSVWTITTKPYAGAHFATFPPELPSRCIRAGSAPGDVVLDPFSGAATTALVARGLGRRAVGIELNPEYLAISADRLRQLSLFGQVAS